MSEPVIGTVPDRTEGRRPTGIVGLRNFDQGVLDSLGVVLVESNYYLSKDALSPMQATPGMPGIPVVFSFPEDMFEKYKLPVVVIRRDDISPAMQRWHPGMVTYRSPAKGARPVSVSYGDPLNPVVKAGFDRYEQQEQAVPFDITYTISILARHRGFGPGGETPTGTASPRTQINKLLDYVLRIFAPYTSVHLKDDLGDVRSYSAFMESISHLDELAQVTERVIGFALTLRVEAELDLSDPTEHTTVFGGTPAGITLAKL